MSNADKLEGDIPTDNRLAPGEGIAIELDRGDRMKVVDVAGQQVANLVCYNRHDLDEFLETSFSYSQIRTKDQALPLFSDRGNKMLEVIEDTVGTHYLRGDLCTAGEIGKRFDVDSAPNCHDSLRAALDEYDVSEWLPFPVSIFRRVDENRNDYKILEAGSGPGDYINLRAEMDLLIGVCACPNKWDARNGFSPSSVDVTVYGDNGGGDD